MKKTFVFSIILIVILSGCSNQVKLVDVDIIETDFDLLKAEVIMKRSWKPISEMTNITLETKPVIDISSKEEFFDKYDFTYMSDKSGIKVDLYETLVSHGENGEEVKNDQGNIIFNKGKYIPTIYEENVFIRKAYIRKTTFTKEYSSLNSLELVVEEGSNYKEENPASGFYRESIFKKNDNDEWILDHTIGTSTIWWER